MRRRTRVVVVGAGFAGLAAARTLAKAGVLVTLIDHNPYSTFQPLLYQVATAGMSMSDVSYSIRTYAAKWPNVRARRGALSTVLPEKRRVELDDGSALDYDFLVLATGVTTNWYNVPGAPENAQPLYSLNDAAALRRRLQHCLEDVVAGRRDSVHVVVVGGGSTGVEIAGTLAELRRRTLPLTHPEIRPDQTSVTLVERFDFVLAPYKPRLRNAAAAALRKRGVRLRLGATVASVEPDSVGIVDGAHVPSDVTVWALGVTAPAYVAEWGLPQTKGGRIRVTEALSVPKHPEIFVAGDLAGPPKPLPQLAQPAIQMGEHVGKQILAAAQGLPLRPFSYRDPGIMATVGRAEAVLQLSNGLTMRGWPAWLIWIFIHVAYLLGGRNRITVLVNFFWRYAGPRHAATSVSQ
ncbi:NAD(P)/FAD-dependent oxidoreductase [Streptosporangium sp. KLBMP 9127]|nr:NAD(P)/FAD-dependent oxidoreductase [Streptosporangium sp. KLBMP 9127]